MVVHTSNTCRYGDTYV